jgi:serine/threonine-protein kinase
MAIRTLGSRYLLDEQIGQGGMGVVWRGRDKVVGTEYAIKVLRQQYATDADAVTRFVRERTVLMKFRHPAVVSVHDMIVEGDQLALVMDLVAGGDLNGYQRRSGGALPPAEAARIGAQICDGLAAAHAAGIVHRDLKPANVLLDNGQVRLADFGVARIVGDQSATTTGTVLGTAAYLAPELLTGSEPSPACDVYALGITLYEVLAGQPPFGGHVAAIMHHHLQTAPARIAGVPDPLWDLIAACVAKQPEDRPTAAALASSLRTPALIGALSAARPVTARRAADAPAAVALVTPPPGGPDLPTIRSLQPAPPPVSPFPTGFAPGRPGGAPGGGGPTPVNPAAGSRPPAAGSRPPAAGSRAPRAGGGESAAPPPVIEVGQARATRLTKWRRKPSPAVLGGGGASAVLVVLVVVALIAQIGPFSSGSKTEAGASTPPVTTGDPAGAGPGIGALTSSPSASASGHPVRGRGSSARGSSGRGGKPSPGKSASDRATPSRSPTKAPTKPKHDSGPLMAYGPSLLVDGTFSQTTLQPWNYVAQNADVEPGAGVDGQNAVQLMSTPQAAVGETITGLTVGTSYQVTGWAHTNGSKIVIGILDTVDNTINDHEQTTAGKWTELSAVFKVPAGQSSATVYCIMAWGGVGYCSDLTFRAMRHS